MSEIEQKSYAPGEHPELPPPPSTVGVIGWMKKNLFSSISNSILTILAFLLVLWVFPDIIRWLFIDAYWGTERADCPALAGEREGACWAFIGHWIQEIWYGRYPHEELWRIRLAYFIAIAVAIPLFIPKFKYKVWCVVFLLLFYPVVAFWLFYGNDMLNLTLVETPLWGGLFLTLVVAVTGIVASLPLGILLALGRQSTNMPMVKSICVMFIELWRGVPLITVLFMASVMFPLFMPEGVNFNDLLRALIGVTIFSAAYMAEVVRGGLQAIPKGQYEGAMALGLPYWKMMGLIVMPQALKVVIPGIVNTFIGLFKDTTLVSIIGMADLLGSTQEISTNPQWLGFAIEGYIFAAFVFWVFCFSMSRYSQALERKLHTGHKR